MNSKTSVTILIVLLVCVGLGLAVSTRSEPSAKAQTDEELGAREETAETQKKREIDDLMKEVRFQQEFAGALELYLSVEEVEASKPALANLTFIGSFEMDLMDRSTDDALVLRFSDADKNRWFVRADSVVAMKVAPRKWGGEDR